MVTLHCQLPLILLTITRLLQSINELLCEPPANRGRCLPKEAQSSDWKNASQGFGVGFEIRTVRLAYRNP